MTTVNSKEVFIPSSRSLAMVFTNDNSKSLIKFYIPDFQRQYSWTNDNLEELWNDLNEAYKNNDDIYFLGSIVLVKEKLNKYSIIDGQQRLTTLVIMMDVLIKDFSDKLNKNLKKRIKKYHSNIFELQNNPSYEQEFQEEIREVASFAPKAKNLNQENDLPNANSCDLNQENDLITSDSIDSNLVTKKDLTSSDPRYKYRNTAHFFYNKFKELDIDINAFLTYIFDNVYVIRTICYDENFAIKMFISLNDRGLPLSNADNFKSWLYSKCKKDQRQTFNQNWKKLVDNANELKITLDDFIVWYEYYLIKSNPKNNVIDVLKKQLEQYDTITIMSDLSKFMTSAKKVNNPSENTNLIYSLRYIKWQPYVMSILTSAFMKKYHDMTSLLKLLRKFYYIAWVSGGNVSSVKQTSFNILQCVVNNKPIDDIENHVNNFIYRKNRISNFYNNLNGNVYGTDFFKPLLMSLEYEEWEDNSLKFQTLDRKIHVDHILPIGYEKDKNQEWQYITKHNEVREKINTMGNMALLQWYKNEKALNKGFKKKLNFYSGFEEDGITPIKDEKGKGTTKFRTTQVIIDEYKNNPHRKWTLNSINERQTYLLKKIEKMLDIQEDDKNINFDLESQNIGRSKWKYNNQIYDNKKFIKQLLKDYITFNKIRDFKNIPDDLSKFKIYYKEFITDKEDLHNRYLLEINKMKLYVVNTYYSSETPNLVSLFQKYYDFEYERITKDK